MAAFGHRPVGYIGHCQRQMFLIRSHTDIANEISIQPVGSESEAKDACLEFG